MSENKGKPAARRVSERAVDPTPVGKWIGLGVGAGIGSAAIAAALLYASRIKKPGQR